MSSDLISIVGYDKLGTDGRRFVWGKEGHTHYIESAAFVNRRKGMNEGICGYTTSVSFGCILRTFKAQCLFCRTGNVIPFGGVLSYKEIAKQNVFMVLADMLCEDQASKPLKQREFAYMGQGEPGFSYPQVRLAIELTNRIMKQLGQPVYRHVFATSGVLESICAFKDDLKDFFTERVTLHFSLHAAENRDKIMPINKLYHYDEIISILNDIYDISGEKPCVGIMLFEKFRPKNKEYEYSNSYDTVKKILSELNPQKCRLSFCEYNESDDIGTSEVYPLNNAIKLIRLADELGFESKIFSSFGKEKNTACGMLGAKEPENISLEQWHDIELMTNSLIENNL